MISWLHNSSAMEKKKVEPGATFSALEDHWKQIIEVMKTSQDADGAETVISHLGQMISFLRMARLNASPSNSCKTFWLENRCSDKVIKWLHYLQIQGIQFPSEVEKKLVEMLHSLCELAAKDGELLGYIHDEEPCGSGDGNWDGAYSLASLLLEYSLRNDGNLGETARYCFILLIQLASKHPTLENNLTQGSGRGLTNVVISGLSACFSTLPTFINSSRDQLRAFTIQLRFVDEVCRASSPSIATIVSECFMNAFLLSVIQPALTQSLNEEIAAVTNYFQTVCEQLTHPSLIRSLITFTNSNLLPILIQRISHPNVLIVISTLRLFNVLFEFYCEDFWFQTILRYLVPENHLMVSQRNTKLQEIDYHESSIRLLSLVPLNIIDAIGSDHLTCHYLQYLSNESQRFMDTVFLICNNTNAVPVVHASGIKQDSEDDEQKQSSSSMYPLWKYKYDGTDKFVLGTLREASNEPRGNEAQVSVNGTENAKDVKNEDPLSVIGSSGTEITSLPDDVQLSDERHSTKPAESLIGRSCSRNSSDGLSSSEVASFGQFLDSIFVQLRNWPHLDPQVILVLSELVSTVAACRIPLLASVLLDSNLTLQPYYVTFISLLKRIKEDLEYHLKSYPPAVIREVWGKLDDTDNAGRRSSGTSSYSALTTIRSQPPSSANADNLGEKIIKGTALISSAMQSFFTKKAPSSSSITASPSSPTSSLASTNNPSSLHSVGPQEYRYVVRNQKDDHARKTMALRAILFSHWIFELAAITQQLSWRNV